MLFRGPTKVDPGAIDGGRRAVVGRRGGDGRGIAIEFRGMIWTEARRALGVRCFCPLFHCFSTFLIICSRRQLGPMTDGRLDAIC